MSVLVGIAALLASAEVPAATARFENPIDLFQIVCIDRRTRFSRSIAEQVDFSTLPETVQRLWAHGVGEAKVYRFSEPADTFLGATFGPDSMDVGMQSKCVVASRSVSFDAGRDFLEARSGGQADEITPADAEPGFRAALIFGPQGMFAVSQTADGWTILRGR